MSATQKEFQLRGYVAEVGRRARAASRELASARTGAKNAALAAIAEVIEARSEALLSANAKDLQAAERDGLAAPLLDRLTLSHSRVQGMADGLRQVAALTDPVGQISDINKRPSGIEVGRMRVPLGVIGI
ncbi:MAG: gamma-glutamyl-phosphate reductase, partial [Gammaproteobacteria bacterium]